MIKEFIFTQKFTETYLWTFHRVFSALGASQPDELVIQCQGPRWCCSDTAVLGTSRTTCQCSGGSQGHIQDGQGPLGLHHSNAQESMQSWVQNQVQYSLDMCTSTCVLVQLYQLLPLEIIVFSTVTSISTTDNYSDICL